MGIVLADHSWEAGTDDHVGRPRGGGEADRHGREHGAAARIEGDLRPPCFVSRVDRGTEGLGTRLGTGRGMEITTRPRSRRWRRVAGWLSLLTAAMVACLLLPASLGLSQHVVPDGAMGGGLARGALLFERPVQTADQLNVGDVITFPRPDAPAVMVTRRVVSIEGSHVVTRGDAMPEADPWVLEVDGVEPALTVLAVPFAGYPQLLAPWLTWMVLAVLAGLATLAAVLVARREASRSPRTVRQAPDASAAAAV